LAKHTIDLLAGGDMAGLVKRIRQVHREGTLWLAIEGEIGGWIAKLGEPVGSERIIYNSWTFAIFHRFALEIAPTLVEAVRTHFPQVMSVADFGCGTGVYVKTFRHSGVDAVGFEYSDIGRRWARERSGVDVQPFDLRTFADAGRAFDLALSLEVAEHLEPQLALRLVDVCCAHAPTVIFSAARPGQGGQGHINPQPKSYWIERFAERGYHFDQARTRALQDYLRARLARGFWVADNLGTYFAVRPNSIRAHSAAEADQDDGRLSK
jgi:SAM-dependent methyltransferase